jgi:hypothetical protein
MVNTTGFLTLPISSQEIGGKGDRKGLGISGHWVIWNNENLLWLPPGFRGHNSIISYTGSTLAIGCSTGKVFVIGVSINILRSKAFESLRVSISELAAQGEESTTKIRSRHNVMELENQVGKDEKLSDIGIKQSPLSGTVIPESRTILQAGRLNVFATLQRCSWAVLRLFRPKLEIGYRRLEWQCDCGTPLYGDFRGGSEEITELVREIQVYGYVVTQSGHGMKQMPTGSGQTTTSHSAVSAP